MVVGGVPDRSTDHPARVVAMGLDMLRAVATIAHETGRQLDLRVGVHTGPVVAGVIGTTKFSYDLWGDTVNTASRMESHGASGRIQITRATKELLHDEFVCEPRGTIPIKGKGEVETWYLVEPQGAPLHSRMSSAQNAAAASTSRSSTDSS